MPHQLKRREQFNPNGGKVREGLLFLCLFAQQGPRGHLTTLKGQSMKLTANNYHAKPAKPANQPPCQPCATSMWRWWPQTTTTTNEFDFPFARVTRLRGLHSPRGLRLRHLYGFCTAIGAESRERELDIDQHLPNYERCTPCQVCCQVLVLWMLCRRCAVAHEMSLQICRAGGDLQPEDPQPLPFCLLGVKCCKLC